MDTTAAIDALSALAQDTRFEAMQLLASREPEGLSAGEVARQLNIPQSTMSIHLAVLSRAGLIRPERHSRKIIYHADAERFITLASFLIKSCWSGPAKLSLRLQKEVAA